MLWDNRFSKILDFSIVLDFNFLDWVFILDNIIQETKRFIHIATLKTMYKFI